MFKYKKLHIILALTLIAVVGCSFNKDKNRIYDARLGNSSNLPSMGPNYMDIYEPDGIEESVINSFSPNEISDYQSITYLPMTLEECVAKALATSDVVRDLGVSIIRTPGSMITTFDPAVTYTNARFGEEAALSEFDANVASSVYFQKNDRAFDNRFTGDTNGIFKQDLLTTNNEINKLAATGTLFSLRNNIDYNSNNQAGNRFGSAWQTVVESEFRHPLLQGSGTLFNRIAGPSQQPGVYNGVLIARTNTEISLARFEQGVRNLIANVENAYWDLYFAYRELEAQTDARDTALRLYEEKKEASKSGRGNTLDVASAYEQYLRFENNVINSLEGRFIDGTRGDNGSAGGSFRDSTGVRSAERRLRYLIGLTITDGALLQPSDAPFHGAIVFDWTEAVQSALANRPETRQQKWVVKQKQLELTAARNFLMPRLDMIGTYRFRGLGKNLTGGDNTFNDDVAAGTQNSNAWGDLFSGDFQEWALGAELTMPVGFRRAHNAVRNAELSVQRQHALLEEQERAITLGLSNSIGELRRSFAAMQLSEQRYTAAYEYKRLAEDRVSNAAANIDVLLEAERRVLESRLQFLRAEVEYMLGIRNVHYEKGSLLEYNNVFLTEGESDAQAYRDAQMRFSYRKRSMNYVIKNPSIAQPQPQLMQQGEMYDGNLSADGFYEPGPVSNEGYEMNTPTPGQPIIQESAPFQAIPLNNPAPPADVAPIPLNDAVPMGNTPMPASQDVVVVAAEQNQMPANDNPGLNQGEQFPQQMETVVPNEITGSGVTPHVVAPKRIADDQKPLNTNTSGSKMIDWNKTSPKTGGWVGDSPPETIVTQLNDIEIRQTENSVPNR